MTIARYDSALFFNLQSAICILQLPCLASTFDATPASIRNGQVR